LRGIARRQALAHFRKGKRDMLQCSDEVLDYLDAQVTHIETRPGDTWYDKIGALHTCMEALPDIYHQVIELRYLDGMRPREIVNHLSLSREVVKKRLHRARGLLLACLQKSGTLFRTCP
jgi:RNA polymerase sigma factor (sigma-70 family)